MQNVQKSMRRIVQNVKKYPDVCEREKKRARLFSDRE